MNPTDLFALVESSEFDAEVNLASTPSVFWSIIGRSQAMQALFDLVREDSSAAIEIVARVIELSKATFDSRYANPHDTALAAYVWGLTQTEPTLARIAAGIAAGVEQTWWTREVTDAVFHGLPIFESNTVTSVEAMGGALSRRKNPFQLKNVVSTSWTFVASFLHDLASISLIVTDEVQVVIDATDATVDTFVDLAAGATTSVPRLNLLSSASAPTVVAIQWGA